MNNVIDIDPKRALRRQVALALAGDCPLAEAMEILREYAELNEREGYEKGIRKAVKKLTGEELPEPTPPRAA